MSMQAFQNESRCNEVHDQVFKKEKARGMKHIKECRLLRVDQRPETQEELIVEVRVVLDLVDAIDLPIVGNLAAPERRRASAICSFTATTSKLESVDIRSSCRAPRTVAKVERRRGIG